ncbi:unnamed protein product [Caenorhabditis brenneri]
MEVDNELPRKPSPELELAIGANKQTNRRRFVPSCIIRNAGQSEGPGLEMPQGYLIPLVNFRGRIYRYNNQKLIRLKPNQIDRLATRYNNTHWSVGCSKEPQYYNSPYQEWARTKLDFVMFVHGTGQMVELEIGFNQRQFRFWPTGSISIWYVDFFFWRSGTAKGQRETCNLSHLAPLVMNNCNSTSASPSSALLTYSKTATTPSSTTSNILTLTSSFASESQQCVELVSSACLKISFLSSASSSTNRTQPTFECNILSSRTIHSKPVVSKIPISRQLTLGSTKHFCNYYGVAVPRTSTDTPRPQSAVALKVHDTTKPK